MLQNCDKDELEKCKLQTKELRAAASGKNASDISDNDLEMDAKEAMFKELADKMVACVEEAGENETAMKACKMALAKSGLQ